MNISRGSDEECRIVYTTTAVDEADLYTQKDVTFVMKMKMGYRMRCAYIHMYVCILDRITTVHVTGSSAYKGGRDYGME